MKSYLNFTLNGRQLLPVWIASFFFFLIPVHFLLGEFNELIASDVPAEGPSKLFFLYLTFVLAMAHTFIFYLAKLVIQSLELNGIKVHVLPNPFESEYLHAAVPDYTPNEVNRYCRDLHPLVFQKYTPVFY